MLRIRLFLKENKLKKEAFCIFLHLIYRNTILDINYLEVIQF